MESRIRAECTAPCKREEHDLRAEMPLLIADGGGADIFLRAFRKMDERSIVYWALLSIPFLLTVRSGVVDAAPPWSNPISLVQSNGRLAQGNRLHVVGHIGANLVHRQSRDDGANWTAPTTIAGAASDFPMQYGGLFAQGDTVYLLTAAGDMGGSAQPADFRKSIDNGQTWSSPIRLTGSDQGLRRARIVAHDNYVHVAGLGTEKNGFVLYFRSADGGKTWSQGKLLADSLAVYGGGQTLAVDRNILHIPYTKVRGGVGAGDTYYIRSTDNGLTWSVPVLIGEKSAESSRQARAQVAAANGRVFVIWQREAESTGQPIPPDRLGYNRSNDGGASWTGPMKLPDDKGVNREHQHVWMTSTGAVHVGWWDGGKSTGYKHSPDYGAAWDPSETAIAANEAPIPYSLIGNADFVHYLTGPQGSLQYSRRPLQNTVVVGARGKNAGPASRSSESSHVLDYLNLLGRYLPQYPGFKP